MKLWILGGAVILALSSCREKQDPEDVAEGPGPRRAAGGGGKWVPADGESAPASGKLRERPDASERRIPVAEPIDDMPGFVMSPFSGKTIDVKGIPAGTLVADPDFPSAENRHFRVPEMPGNNGEDEAPPFLGEAGAPAPIARPVPGKAGFVFSPFNNKIIDVTGIEPGTEVADPSYPAEEGKYFTVPPEGVAVDEAAEE